MRKEIYRFLGILFDVLIVLGLVTAFVFLIQLKWGEAFQVLLLAGIILGLEACLDAAKKAWP